MARIRINVINKPERKSTADPLPIPAWLDNPKAIAPCPCGRPPHPGCVLVKGDVPLSRWFHPECLEFLKHEMSPDEIQEMEESERRQREEEDDA